MIVTIVLAVMGGGLVIPVLPGIAFFEASALIAVALVIAWRSFQHETAPPRGLKTRLTPPDHDCHLRSLRL